MFSELYDRYIDGEMEEPPSERIAAYVATLLERWLTEDDEDTSPWSTGPLIDEASGPLIYFAMRWSMAEEALLRESENAVGAVEEMIRRPDVAHKVMASPSNQRILYRAHHEQRLQAAAERFTAAQARGEEPDEETGQEQTAAPSKQREPAVNYQRASREVLELIGSGTAFLVDLQRMIPNLHVGEFTDREIRAVLDNHRRIRAALDWCDSALATGDKSMDEELARILSEGGEEL
jgi:hypothetical protein